MAFMSSSSNRRDPFGRLPMPRQPDPEIENIRNPYKLSSSVGVAAPNNRRDVAKVEALMTETGNLDLHQTDGVTGYYGERLKQAIEGFQKDNGLRKDGLINPRGETMRILKERHGRKKQGAPEERRNKNCQQLRKALTDARAELRSAEYLRDETSRAVNEKQDKVRTLYDEFIKTAASSAVGLLPSTKIAKAGARILNKKVKMPDRNLSLPSDPSEAIAAYEAYETAKRELEILIAEMHRAYQLVEQSRAKERGLRGKLSTSGCHS